MNSLDESLESICAALHSSFVSGGRKGPSSIPRRSTVVKLQRGLRQGESDERLQQLLDTLETIEVEQQQSERATLAEIDAKLSVRQRVKLRFFIQGFRRQMQRRVRELQGDDWPAGPPGPGG